MNLKLKFIQGFTFVLLLSMLGCKKTDNVPSKREFVPPITSSTININETDAEKQRVILFQEVVKSLDRQVWVLESKIKQTKKLKEDSDFQEYLLEKIYWVGFTLEVPCRPRASVQMNTSGKDLVDSVDIYGPKFDEYWVQINKLKAKFNTIQNTYYSIVPREKAIHLLNVEFISTIKNRIYKRFGVK